jgi:hypothetical protein
MSDHSSYSSIPSKKPRKLRGDENDQLIEKQGATETIWGVDGQKAGLAPSWKMMFGVC